jgi:hypothetical protein
MFLREPRAEVRQCTVLWSWEDLRDQFAQLILQMRKPRLGGMCRLAPDLMVNYEFHRREVQTSCSGVTLSIKEMPSSPEEHGAHAANLSPCSSLQALLGKKKSQFEASPAG